MQAGYIDFVENNISKLVNCQNVDSLMERDRVQKELSKIEYDIDSVFSLFAEMGKDTQAASLVKEKLESLAEKKRKLTSYKAEVMAKVEKHNDIKESKAVIENNALGFKNGWKKANPATQKRLMRKLVDRLIYSGGGLHVLYVMAVDNASTVLEKKMNVASEILSEAISKTKNVLEILTNGTTGIQHVAGASVVVSGEP